MIVVIFEASPQDGRVGEYLDIATLLRPQLDEIPGFVSIERFQSLEDPNKVLSLSTWESEADIVRWRTAQDHRAAQRAGRDGIFADYRLRVAGVIRDYGKYDRAQAPTQTTVTAPERTAASKYEFGDRV